MRDEGAQFFFGSACMRELAATGYMSNRGRQVRTRPILPLSLTDRPERSSAERRLFPRR